MKTFLHLLAALCGWVLLTFAIYFLLAPAHAAPTEPPPCMPAQLGGTGTPAKFATTEDGSIVTGWCPAKFGSWTPWHYMAHKSFALPSLAELWDEASKYPTLLDAWRGMPASLAKPLPNDSSTAMLRLGVNSQLAMTKPPAPIWKVPPNGAHATRPTKWYFGGQLSTTEAGRVAVGRHCTCHLGVGWMIGTSAYCGFTGSRGWEGGLPTGVEVALCVKVAQ